MALTQVKKLGLENLVSNNTNDRILTATGISNGINGESALTWDGGTLNLKCDSGLLLIEAANGVDAFSVDSDNGNTYIGGKTHIGSTSEHGPNAYHLANAGLFITAAGENALKVLDSTAYAANVGGAILLGGNYRSTGDTQPFVELKSFKENATDANYAYGLSIGTTPNGGSITERVRIDSAGKLLLGTTRTQYANDYYDDITINNSGGSGATGGCGITMISDNDSWGALQFGDEDDDDRCYMKYDHGADSLHIAVNASDIIRVHTDGTTAFATGIGLGNGTTYAASNTLTDYEEGTFTPTNSVGLTLTNNNPAYYIKIGKLVHIQMDISFSGASDSSQCGYIQSLPFTSTNTSNHYAQGSIQHISENGSTAYDEDQNGLLMYVAPDESRIDIVTISNGSVATRAHLEGRRFRISMFYKSTS